MCAVWGALRVGLGRGRSALRCKTAVTRMAWARIQVITGLCRTVVGEALRWLRGNLWLSRRVVWASLRPIRRAAGQCVGGHCVCAPRQKCGLHPGMNLDSSLSGVVGRGCLGCRCVLTLIVARQPHRAARPALRSRRPRQPERAALRPAGSPPSAYQPARAARPGTPGTRAPSPPLSSRRATTVGEPKRRAHTAAWYRVSGRVER